MVMVIESWRGCGMNGGRVMKVEAAFLAMIDWEGSPGYGSSFSYIGGCALSLGSGDD